MAKIQIGDTVQCRFYNCLDKAFYGEVWLGEVLDIGPEPESIALNSRDRWLGCLKKAKIPAFYIDRIYLVTQPGGLFPIRLTLNEIKKLE